MKFTLFFWVLAITLGALVVYEVKYEVRDLKQQVSALDAELLKEQEALHVLEAEWAYLSRPDRLQELSQKYLKLQPVKAGQIQDSSALTLQERGQSGNTLVSMQEGRQ